MLSFHLNVSTASLKSLREWILTSSLATVLSLYPFPSWFSSWGLVTMISVCVFFGLYHCFWTVMDQLKDFNTYDYGTYYRDEHMRSVWLTAIDNINKSILLMNVSNKQCPKILHVEMSSINQVLWFTWLWTKVSKQTHDIYTQGHKK